MKDDCIFCKLANGEIPTNKVYEDDYVTAFYDMNPQAPVHVLIVPKEHIDSALCINADNALYVSKCWEAVPVIASKLGLDNGFRVINNCGEDGGQTVMHIHFHLLGGRKLTEHII